MKTCSKCKNNKPISQFHKNRTTKDGLAGQCKICVSDNYQAWYNSNIDEERKKAREASKRRHYSTKYGISLEDREKIITAQNNCCAICGTFEPGFYGFHMDHDHKTNKIRGALCRICNWTVGNIENGWPILVPEIKKYLEFHSQ